MSVYSIQGKGWRYDFMLSGVRYTHAWYKTKTAAKEAEAERRKEVLEPKKKAQVATDTDFLELVNRRLDYVRAYNSAKHYDDYRHMAKRWAQRWGHLKCGAMTQEMIEQFLLKRKRVSSFTANKDLRYLRATFNFGQKKKLTIHNPTDGIEFLPVDKKPKYIPPPEDVLKVIAVADQDTQDYLFTIRDTVGRMSEINRLRWDDVNLKHRYVTLYTRKKKGGHLTPRKVAMTKRLFEILSRRHAERDPTKPWVFWHTYTSSKTGEKCVGPYKERKKIMRTLCKKAGVRYFRFHGIRHSGASIMENNNVSIRTIQRILGHENRSTTEVYLHNLGDAEKKAMSVLDEAGNFFTHKFTHEGKYVN